jgi:DNA repair protein RecO (recombination protein O)
VIDQPEPTELGAPTLDRRARLYRVRAIVLRRRDTGEADRIVTLFTAEHGKRRVVAKGTRRPGSRLAGHLEPFCAASLLVARTRTLDIVSQADTIEAFAAVRQTELGIATAGYLCELVDALLPEDQPQEQVYELLFAALRLLADGRNARLVRHVFEMGLLRQLGYRPELYVCVVCGVALEQEANGFIPEGGVVCPRCLRLRPDAADLSVDALKLLRAIDRGGIDLLLRLRIPTRIWDEVDVALARYLERITGRESHAMRVLGQLRLE